MFFKKKKDDFELKTEESYTYDDSNDSDFFRYDDEVVEPYVASSNSDEFIIDKTNNDEVVINNTVIEETPEVHNETYIYTDSDNNDDNTSEEVNNTYVNVNNMNYYEDEEEKERFHLSYKLIYILNKVFSVLLVITIVIAIIVLFDVIMLTRFGKGPFFAIKTKTYDDGGTKVYNGIGYKVIKYKELNGRRDMVVGNYSIKYNTKALNISLESLSKKFKSDYDDSFKKYVSEYLNVSGTISSINLNTNTITLKYTDDNNNKYILECNDVEGKISKLKKGDKVKIKGNLYVESVDSNIEFYLENSVLSK